MEKSTTITDGGTMDDRLWSNLPPEIVIDVLYRLPVKSLCRFKCVSPSWKTLISSPHFAQTHHRRIPGSDNAPYKAILFSSSKDIHTLDFADANPTPKKLNLPSWLFKHTAPCPKSLSSCNGLVLVSDSWNFNLMLNPCTCEYKELPAPFRKYSSGNFLEQPVLGYDSYTDDYKVVSLVYGYNNYRGYIDSLAVYSLKTDAWRMIQDFPYIPVVGGRGVCFKERIHWLCRRTGGLVHSRAVVAFSLSDEIFGEVQLPALGDDRLPVRDRMLVLGGCLCLLVWSERERIDVWMMMKYGVGESWTKFSTTFLGCSVVDVPCFSVQDELVMGRRRLEHIRWLSEGDEIILHNPKKGTQRAMVVPGIPKSTVGNHYIESLISPNHGWQFSETM